MVVICGGGIWVFGLRGGFDSEGFSFDLVVCLNMGLGYLLACGL